MGHIVSAGLTGLGRLLMAGLFVGLGLIGGIALASDDGGGEEIHVCARTNGASDGFLRLVDDETDCRKNETALSWNKSGVPGPQGPAGPPGTSEAYFATLERNVRVVLPTDGGSFIEVLAKDVPAGKYAVNATAWIYNGTPDEATTAGCVLSGGTLFVSHNAFIEELDSADIPMIGVVEFAAPGTLVMACGGLDGAPTLLQASITAIRVDSIQ